MIEKMLQKDPTERYQTAYGLLQDLKRCRALALSGKLDESFPLGQDDKVRILIGSLNKFLTMVVLMELVGGSVQGSIQALWKRYGLADLGKSLS